MAEFDRFQIYALLNQFPEGAWLLGADLSGANLGGGVPGAGEPEAG